MSLLVVPAVDVSDGKCVQLVGGDPERKIFEHPDPVDVAERWAEDFPLLHVVDIDAARGEGDNVEVIRSICEVCADKGTDVQVGGGIRDVDRALRLIRAGASRVIVGTLALKDPEGFERLAAEVRERGGEVFAALDVTEDGKVLVEGWREGTDVTLERAARELEDAVDGYLVTAVHVEGRMRGVDRGLAERVASLEPRALYSGGVSSVEDLELLDDVGVWGVVVGSALYTGKLDVEDALRFLR